MPFSDPSTISPICLYLGESDAAFRSAYEGSGSIGIVSAREGVQTGVACTDIDTDLDNGTIAIQGFRSLEASLENSVIGLISSAANTLNTFFVNNEGSTFKSYYDGLTNDTTIGFSTEFVRYWRTARSEELCVPLGIATGSGSTWNYEATDYNTTDRINAALQLRVDTAPTGTDVTATFNMEKSDGTTEAVAVIVGAGSTSSVAIQSTNTQYARINGTPTITGSSTSATISVWVTP